MTELILHVGGPKCASSTIQAYLSDVHSRPSRFNLIGQKKYRYMCVDNKGILTTGEDLYSANKHSSMGYISSHSFLKSSISLKEMFSKVKANLREKEIGILSNESWGREARILDFGDIFESLEINVRVFFAVRAPIEWLNSGYWQWGAWDGLSVDKWVEENVKISDFEGDIEAWKAVRGVKDVHVVELSENPLKKFKEFLNVKDKWEKQTNVGSHPALLEFLLANQERYGRTIHNPLVEFKLNEILQLEPVPLPFVINPKLRDIILERTLSQSKKLHKYFDDRPDRLNSVFERKYYSDEAYNDLPIADVKNLASEAERNEFQMRLIDMALNKSALSSLFNPDRYFDLNQDLDEETVNPFEHFLVHGIKEGRPH